MEINDDQNDLNNLDKELLIRKIRSMQQHIKQLKNIIKKYESEQRPKITNASISKTKPRKEFNFSQYNMRHVLLRFLYLGWNYDGYVVQEDHSKTVEKIIFEALLKTKLIENRETCNYHRCGRTDKGVSAFYQVISLTVRSKMKCGFGLIKHKNYIENHEEIEQIDPYSMDYICDEELDYVSILNKVLPNDIRVIAWAPVFSSKISARFDCTRRVYQYYFPRIDLDIEKMNEACSFLIGEHDFRNLCKMDISNGVINYTRRIYDAMVQTDTERGTDSICVFRIEASAFLWHQIRYIMAILFLVGQHLEPPNIIAELLDIEKHPFKPQYMMSSDLPLVLFEAHYDHNKVPKWFYGKNIKSTVADLYAQWADKSIKSLIIKSMIDSLKMELGEPIGDKFIKVKKLFGYQTKIYKKIFDRPLCDSLENQMKKRIKLL